MIDRLVLCLAQGFYIGRIPVMPGTFGSLLGLVWLAVLLTPRHLGLFVTGCGVAALASVWVCGRAERILQKTDPGSVVLDEIVAIPICFAGWIGLHTWNHHAPPGPEWLMADGAWLWTIGLFGAFRFFDIAKPWPVRQSQHLPGGWGVTVDDLLAAVYVNVVAGLIWGIKTWLGR
jgi:phosphatidylglycerophosphatase A